MTHPSSLVADLVELLDPDMRYLFEERAGIIEFDGEQPRDFAECLALIDLLRTHPCALIPIALVQIEVNGVTEFALTTDVDCSQRRCARTADAVVARVDDSATLINKHFGGMALLRRVV